MRRQWKSLLLWAPLLGAVACAQVELPAPAEPARPGARPAALAPGDPGEEGPVLRLDPRSSLVAPGGVISKGNGGVISKGNGGLQVPGPGQISGEVRLQPAAIVAAGAGVISKGNGGYRVAAAEEQSLPLPVEGIHVRAYPLAGNTPIPGVEGSTDAQGRFLLDLGPEGRKYHGSILLLRAYYHPPLREGLTEAPKDLEITSFSRIIRAGKPCSIELNEASEVATKLAVAAGTLSKSADGGRNAAETIIKGMKLFCSLTEAQKELLEKAPGAFFAGFIPDAEYDALIRALLPAHRKGAFARKDSLDVVPGPYSPDDLCFVEGGSAMKRTFVTNQAEKAIYAYERRLMRLCADALCGDLPAARRDIIQDHCFPQHIDDCPAARHVYLLSQRIQCRFKTTLYEEFFGKSCKPEVVNLVFGAGKPSCNYIGTSSPETPAELLPYFAERRCADAATPIPISSP